MVYKSGDDNLYIRVVSILCMKKGVFLLLVLLVIPFTSAELLFSQLGQSYSFGDQATAQLTVTSNIAQTDFLDADVVCGQSRIDFYRAPLTFSQPGEKTVDLSFMVSQALFDTITGTCAFSASYGESTRESSSFILTRTLIIEPTFAKTIYAPDEKVVITGTARTPNGRAVNGYADVSFAGLSFSGLVKDGQFSLELALPHAIAPSEHELSIHVYEKDSAGYISNEGTFTKNIGITELFDKISIVTSSPRVVPGEQFTYTVFALDQVGNKISRDVLVQLYDPSGTIVFSHTIPSGVEQVYPFNSDAAMGYWKLEAQQDTKKETVLLNVPENQLATFQLEGGSVIAQNIGNVPYKKIVEFMFDNVSVSKEVSIPLGGTRKLKLSAPSSTYTISINDGQNELVSAGVSLTGRAIDVGNTGSLSNVLSIIPALVIVGVIVILFFWVKQQRSRRFNYGESPSVARVHSIPKTVNFTSARFSEGEKEDATLVAVFIPQRPSHEEGIGLISDLRASLTGSGAHVIDEGTVVVGLFTKRVSGDDFMARALRSAFECSQKVQEYNRLARYKVRAGVGIVDGQLITGYEKGKLSYASVQNSIGRAKNLAAASEGSLLASDSLYRKMASAVSAERAEKGWKITRVKDHTRHNSFIDGFVKRNDFRK